ncbi:uncharacterized protein VTP21DRAFT_9832 [Calcarisporiella thermophila]|uniref:uncharacterized protein n=1 Tax=Calcarisporiella thermophila TaxID=911321 RepID=UPI0037427DD2
MAPRASASNSSAHAPTASTAAEEKGGERFTSKFFPDSELTSVTSKCTAKWKEYSIPSEIRVRSILSKLREISLKKPEEQLEEEEEPKLEMGHEEEEEIETVRKERVFEEDVNEQEMEIIQKRVALQQRKFQEFERREKQRKYRKVRAMFDYLADEEIDEALADCENDEDEVIVRFTQPGYLYDVRKNLAHKHSAPESTTGMTDEQREAYQQLLKKRSETLKKTTTESAKKQYRMGGRLGLDEAIRQAQMHKIDPKKAFEGWSQARIRAWDQRDKNPNSYYYRFNAPGEVQRKGQWTKEEEKVFFKRLDEIGANGQWGIFSMAIPGRVGYQCSNFYRLLIESGRVKDPNYVLDEKGKAHYLFSHKNKETGKEEKVFRTHRKHGSAPGTVGGGSVRATRSTAGKKGKRKRKTYSGDTDEDEDDFEDEDDSGEYVMKSWNPTKRVRSSRSALSREFSYAENDEEEEEEDELFDENPLPGFIDPITLEEVEKPAICKYGHVMGYDSWIRCLTAEATKNICPMTKQHMTKRDLVILTHDNIEEYRDKIVNS